MVWILAILGIWLGIALWANQPAERHGDSLRTRACELTMRGWQCSTTDGPSIEIIEDVPFPEARDA
jgi:hypothetical protein